MFILHYPIVNKYIIIYPISSFQHKFYDLNLNNNCFDIMNIFLGLYITNNYQLLI